MDTIYSLYKYYQIIYSSEKQLKLAKPLDGCSSTVKPFFRRRPIQAQAHSQNATSETLYLQLMDELPTDYP